MTQKKPTEPSIIKNWVKTASIQMENGEMFHMIEDIMGEPSEDEKAEIRHRLAAMSLALRELCSSEQTFQFLATFTREVGETEWQVSHPEILTMPNEKSNVPQEKAEKMLADIFHILTDKLKDIVENHLWKEPTIGIYHSIFNERYGGWERQFPFKTPLILPSIEKKVDKILHDLDEDGMEKYIKVEVDQWTGKVKVETIATLDDKYEGKFGSYDREECKECYSFLKEVKREAHHMTDEDWRDFMPRYEIYKDAVDSHNHMDKVLGH